MFLFSNISFIALLIISVIVTYQDFKERLVSFWILILLGTLCLASVLINRDTETTLINTASISLYLLFLWGVLKLYLYLKHKKWIALINEQLGMADVLVMLFIGLTFNPIGQILFFCTAFLFSLIAFLLYGLVVKSSTQNTIPLAGLLVFYYLAIITLLSINPISIIDCSFINK